MRDSLAVVERLVASDGAVIYGVNTGFGALAGRRIPRGRLRELQRRLVLSHCAGAGPLLADGAVRLAIALKANAMARGHSGVRPLLVDSLLRLLERGICPCIPAKGSAGASGDLAPLAHLAHVLISGGRARVGGRVLSGRAALARAGLEPVTLEPKEGLAFLNGTQVSAALALTALFQVERVFHAALVAGALSVEAARGGLVPFDPRIQEVRGQPGQADAARAYRALLAGSRMRGERGAGLRVQDPYSLRCQPQVMGACLDAIRHAASVLGREANAVTDNPLVFAADGAVLSGGNFHGEPVAMAADALAVAVAEIGALSERRTALLVDSQMSGLPPFLAVEPGVSSGFMIAQIVAAALASANKGLAHPASVDSLPTSANQEDHVSMSAHAAYRLGEMIDNAAGVVAIELLAAAQGVDMLKPLRTSPALARALALVRRAAPFRAGDRPFDAEIAAAKDLILSGRFDGLPGAELLPSRR
jgi:histidine ammonia-lyase